MRFTDIFKITYTIVVNFKISLFYTLYVFTFYKMILLKQSCSSPADPPAPEREPAHFSQLISRTRNRDIVVFFVTGISHTVRYFQGSSML